MHVARLMLAAANPKTAWDCRKLTRMQGVEPLRTARGFLAEKAVPERQ